MRSILNIAVKELLQLRRDPLRLRMTVFVPVIQLILLGYAANLDVKKIPMIVYDADQSEVSRALTDRFLSSGYYLLVGHVDRYGDIDGLLARGDATFAVVFPKGFGAEVKARRTAVVQGIADGSDAAFSARALNYAAMIVQRYSSGIMLDRMRAAGVPEDLPGVDARVRVWFNPELSSTWFLVTGILALVLMIVTLMGTAMTVVREKEIGTMEQLIVTPIRSYELVLGKLIPNALVGMVVVCLVLTVVHFLFRVPIQGSVFLLLGLCLIFLVSMQGLGLFISTASRTQQQAMMSAIFFAMLPMLLLSGFVFPIENMPAVIQGITYLIPLRYFFVIIRGILLKGAGLSVLWDEALALVVFAAAMLALSVVRFQKRLG